ncbi:VLTF3 late transcription factor protein [Pacmanvirus A23]|uniref:VLTF3 late transcription factor protein n=1 Tax=Pacmanvirus A23 TaxID=1932881 RepID=UPI000A0960F0|nr:VLTF3 late transcription factor protein [Pacmanvirus A23]SIP85912.1 VLTF3 late transcription factor protein [Pacmanvirus A23]
MYGTIENTHNKITEKISLIKQSLEDIKELSSVIRIAANSKTGKKYTECVQSIDNLRINFTIDALDTIESNYHLSIIGILSDYYQNPDKEERNTRDYYRTITSENFISTIDDIILRTRCFADALYKALRCSILPKPDTKELEYELDDISKNIEWAGNIEVNIVLEKRNYEVCKCGNRMTVVPELSELHCTNPVCSKIKTIIGTVFRDDQFYPQEGQKTKHGGYDTSRHYRFWIERLQALESKTFTDEEINKIEYVISRDGYDRRELNCEIMREILKDPIVNATHLNDHAPLLVKIFGGLPPPQLDFQENRLCAIRFNKAMKLYDIVNPEGGNKPYYPYFIYKILEYMFKDNPEKLRLLDYIHLQSRETVIKNDKFYFEICELSDDPALVYTPTDPADRL